MFHTCGVDHLVLREIESCLNWCTHFQKSVCMIEIVVFN
jgi:hypothetical protein